MKTFDIKVERDGKWWMIHVPELEGLTQARRLSEVRQMAAEWIALTLDLRLSEVEVNITDVDVAGLDAQAAGELVAQLREDVSQLETLIAGITTATAHKLVSEGVPTRDVAEVLGLSHQRISQIVSPYEAGVDIVVWDSNVFAWFTEIQSDIERTLEPVRQQQVAIDAVLEPLRKQQEAVAAAMAPLRRQQEAMAAALAPLRRHQDAIRKAMAPYRDTQARMNAASVSARRTSKVGGGRAVQAVEKNS